MYLKYNPKYNDENLHYWEFGCECGHIISEETASREMVPYKIQTLFNKVRDHTEKPHKFKIGELVIRSLFESMGMSRYLGKPIFV